jgi:hypothetical protein
MAINSLKDLVDAEERGQTFLGGFRKVPNAATNGNAWFDVTLSPGNPLPFYYASTPLAGAPMGQATNGGIPHNLPVASLGYKTYLKSININPGLNAGSFNGMMILMDYLFYYPFIDTGLTDPQVLDNTASLTRYTSGKGVSVMAVQLAGLLGSGNPTFRFTYVNQDGVSQTSPTQTCGTALIVGELATGNNSATSTGSANSNYPFLALAPGDTGVRSIQSITFDAPDVGLIALVLVKPLEQIAPRENGTGVERTPVLDFFDLPVIEDNAYLSLLLNTGLVGASTAPFFGTIQTVWG